MASKFATKWRRSLLKRYDNLRERLGLPEAPGWNRARAEGIKAWLAERAKNEAMRYDYPLTPDDVVLDLGGYRGEWAAEIQTRYGSRVHVFEPVVAFSDAIAQRFEENDLVSVYPFGLAGADATITLCLDEDATSACGSEGDRVEGQLRDAAAFLEDNHLEEIALTKINIEGGEYELLESLLDRGLVRRFRNLQVQFHTFAPDAQPRMEAIQRRLSETHAPTYQFPFVWENWRRRDAHANAA